MESEKFSISKMIKFIGAILAFSIGSGFATGQELLQFFAAYHYEAILVALVFFLIFGYSNYAYAKAGNLANLENGTDVYRYFCGNIIGTGFDYFSVFFCYMSYMVMVGGAAATMEQQYGVPLMIGGGILAVSACITVMFGLQTILNILGKVGPVIVVIALFIGITAAIKGYDRIPEGIELIKSGQVEVKKASTHWLWAGGAYGGFCMLWFGGFMARMGATNRMKELAPGILIAAILNAAAGVIVGFALIANIQKTAGTQIPNLILATDITPIFATFFALIILAAIYTTSVPLLWTASSRLAKEGTAKFKAITAALALIGYMIAMTLPFSDLLNWVYVVNGYAGIALLFIIIGKNIWLSIQAKKTA